MFDRGELKRAAKNDLSGKWGIMIAICLVNTVIQYFLQNKDDISIWVMISGLIIVAPVALSIAKIALNLSSGIEEPKLSQLGYGFKNIWKAIGLYIIIIISICVGILVFIVPGIIVGLMFGQALYVLADNPEIGIFDALEKSCSLTKGYKWEIFVLGLSFLGWMLVGVLTFGIGLLWVVPYMEVTNAELYLFLKGKKDKVII